MEGSFLPVICVKAVLVSVNGMPGCAPMPHRLAQLCSACDVERMATGVTGSGKSLAHGGLTCCFNPMGGCESFKLSMNILIASVSINSSLSLCVGCSTCAPEQSAGTSCIQYTAGFGGTAQSLI
jgi:hypothetical protein